MSLRKFFVILLVVLFLPKTSFACMCERPDFEDAFNGAGIVVTASIIEKIGADKVLLRFDDVWKGIAPNKKEAIIYWGTGSACGPTKQLQPDIGTKYVLFLDDVYNDLPVRVHLVGCDRGGLYEEHLEDIQKLQKYRGKLEVLNKEIEHHKSSKDLFLKKTFFLKEHGDFSNAEQILIELINAYPSDDELFSELAELSYQRGEKMSLLGYYDEVTIRKKMKSQSYREALNYSEKALSINPGNGKAKYINIAAKSYLDEETNGGLR